MNKQKIYRIVGVIIILLLISLSCYIRYETKLEVKPKRDIDSLHSLTPKDIPADSLMHWE